MLDSRHEQPRKADAPERPTDGTGRPWHATGSAGASRGLGIGCPAGATDAASGVSKEGIRIKDEATPAQVWKNKLEVVGVMGGEVTSGVMDTL